MAKRPPPDSRLEGQDQVLSLNSPAVLAQARSRLCSRCVRRGIRIPCAALLLPLTTKGADCPYYTRDVTAPPYRGVCA